MRVSDTLVEIRRQKISLSPSLKDIKLSLHCLSSFLGTIVFDIVDNFWSEVTVINIVCLTQISQHNFTFILQALQIVTNPCSLCYLGLANSQLCSESGIRIEQNQGEM